MDEDPPDVADADPADAIQDPRVREHARTLVEWSARVEAGDDVVLVVGPDAEPLAVALARELGDRGASLLATYASGEVTRAYLRAAGADGVAASEPELAMYEAADAVLSLGGGRNPFAMSDVPGEARQARDRAGSAAREARLATDWVTTVHPTRALAQQAGMSLEAYRAFAYGAINRDWGALADEMAILVEHLDAADRATLRVADRELRLSIANRTAVNSAASVAYGSHNLPSGEVFTAPVADSVEGEVLFDVPLPVEGQRVRDVHLTFEDGEVVEFSAVEGEDAIADVLATDAGARRLGELGIGMNPGIDRPTGTLLFDEKMAGTVHLALGRAYDDNLPEGESGNESAVHVDLVADVTADATLSLDGEVVMRDGTWRWEDEFVAAG